MGISHLAIPVQDWLFVTNFVGYPRFFFQRTIVDWNNVPDLTDEIPLFASLILCRVVNSDGLSSYRFH